MFPYSGVRHRAQRDIGAPLPLRCVGIGHTYVQQLQSIQSRVSYSEFHPTMRRQRANYSGPLFSRTGAVKSITRAKDDGGRGASREEGESGSSVEV